MKTDDTGLDNVGSMQIFPSKNCLPFGPEHTPRRVLIALMNSCCYEKQMGTFNLIRCN